MPASKKRCLGQKSCERKERPYPEQTTEPRSVRDSAVIWARSPPPQRKKSRTNRANWPARRMNKEMEQSIETLTVFYSWQSDTASNINRNFIEKALKAALKAIATEAELTARPELDKDTQGVTGSPAVAETIFA